MPEAGSARTLTSDLATAITSYDISLVGPGGSIELPGVTERTTTVTGLISGQWSVTVIARNSAGAGVASGAADATVVPGSRTEKPYVLSESDLALGGIQVVVSDDGITEPIEVTLTASATTVEVNQAVDVTASISPNDPDIEQDFFWYTNAVEAALEVNPFTFLGSDAPDTYTITAIVRQGEVLGSASIRIEVVEATEPADQDGDGYAADVDCDDSNSTVYPGAVDVCNGIDDDCDGVADEDCGPITVDELEAGDLVINEIMFNPDTVADSAGEWFEVYIATDGAVNLRDLEVSDDDFGAFFVNVDLVVQPGDYVVFAAGGDLATNGGVDASYAYGNFTLANSGDEIRLSNTAGVIDEVVYDTGGAWAGIDIPGASIQLDPASRDAGFNDFASSWCAPTSSTYGDGDAGTPGRQNDSCF